MNTNWTDRFVSIGVHSWLENSLPNCAKFNLRSTKSFIRLVSCYFVSFVTFCSNRSLPSVNCIASPEDHCGQACTEGSKEEFERKSTKVTKLRPFLRVYYRRLGHRHLCVLCGLLCTIFFLVATPEISGSAH